MEEEHFKFIVEKEKEGERLDKFLTDKLLDKFSRVFIQKLIARSKILVNDASSYSNHRVKCGDVIEGGASELIQSSITAEAIPLKIVFEDKHFLVVNKPPDMVVHPAPGNISGTLVNALLHHCKDLSGIGGVQKPGIVHRLDKGTSGLIVIAKTDEAHRKISKQFKDKTIRKVYIAIVKGVVELDNGIIEVPLGRHAKDRKRMAVKFAEGKEAVTRYKVLERFTNATMLEVVIETGRTHQIRVHLSYIGHPVLGDEKYGMKDEIGRPALHAKSISFIHPATKKQVEFVSELPKDMVRLIKRLREK